MASAAHRLRITELGERLSWLGGVVLLCPYFIYLDSSLK
jgi:hypothetical protein